MSQEQLKAFAEKAQADPALQAKIKVAPDPETVIGIAKEAGFTITAEDLSTAEGNLTDEDLEGVAGGTTTLITISIIYTVK